MKQEELVDQLLSLPREGMQIESGEVAGCLEAARRVQEWEGVEVPVELATRLEQALRARLRSSALRQQRSRTASGRGVILIAGRRRSAGSGRTPKRRPWIALLGTAAALVLSFASLFAFSVYSLPGDPLYGLKQAQNQFTLIFAHDQQGRMDTELNLLQNALSDLRSVANDRRGDQALILALKTVAARTDDCRATLARLPAGSQRSAAQGELTAALAREEQTLRQLLAPLDWPLRVLFTRQLGELGDPVPVVMQVAVQTLPAGVVQVTLVGAHFASGARFVLNGQPTGQVSKVTAWHLVVLLSSAQWLARSHTIGMLNPDGTAAQLAHQEDNNGHRTGTPVPDE